MNPSLRRLLLAGGCALAFHVTPARANVKLPLLFSDHLVLQRDQPVPVWGEAAAGEKVTVKFRNQEKTTAADNHGKWLVNLDPLTVGEPGQLIITGANTITLNDVVVGEVWVGSGQSNMALTTDYFAKNDPVLAAMAAESNTQVRLVAVNRVWQLATPAAINGFSALLFAFGSNLQKELKVPVGLMVGAVGGTPSGFWVTREMLTNDPPFNVAVTRSEAIQPFSRRQQQYDEILAKYKMELAEWEANSAAAKTQTNTSLSVPAPKFLPKPIPPVAPLRAGEASQKAGYLYEAHIQPLQPYAIRGVLWDQGEGNTGLQGIDQYTTMGALIKGWRKAWGEGDFPFLYVQKPSGLGCAWDPENPVTKNADAFKPLPPVVPNADATVEQFVKIMSYPKTAMVTSSDLGAGIHPVNKSGYGQRAAMVALGLVYGKNIAYYGPVYDSHTIEGDKVRVHFKHVGQGLAFKHGDTLQGFALAGPDKKWHWADAVIDGDTVILTSKEVSQPVAVRYAWATVRPWANFFNQDGLPAIPFCTRP